MFGSNQKLDFTDITSDNNSMKSRSRWGGCFVRTTTGFILALLAIFIAVGVGIIVHFAGSSHRNIQCQCSFPKPLDDGSASGRQSDETKDTEENKYNTMSEAFSPLITSTSPTSNSAWDQCNVLAKDRNQTICETCVEEVTESTEKEANKTERVEDVRLPASIIPIVYDVELQPYIYEGPPENFTFDGYVNINMKCLNNCTNITLHSHLLNINESSVDLSSTTSDKVPTVNGMVFDKKRQFLIFNLSDPLENGHEYNIRMNFTGNLRDDLNGLYRSSYKRGNKTV
ncbi:hypothetical protein Ahia01_000855400, partial [Argonauta hians]